jgi:hypothetical protein
MKCFFLGHQWSYAWIQDKKYELVDFDGLFFYRYYKECARCHKRKWMEGKLRYTQDGEIAGLD